MNPDSQTIAQCISGADQRFLAVDRRYADLLMDTPEGLIGRHPLEFTHPDDRGANAVLLDRVCHDGTPFSITKRYVRRDGSTVWVNNHISRLTERGVHRLVVTCRPIERPAVHSPVEQHWRTAKLLVQALLAGKAAFGTTLITCPPAEILLLLYAAEAEGRSETLDTAAARIALATPLASRWIDALVEAGLVETEARKAAGGPAALRLSPGALTKLEAIFARLVETSESATLAA